MKNTLLIVAVLVLSACATTWEYLNTPIPTVKSVTGTYERNIDGDAHKLVFLENGVRESYLNGKKVNERKWSIVNGELHVYADSLVYVWSIKIHAISLDGKPMHWIPNYQSITWIAVIKDGKRTDTPIEKQYTYMIKSNN